MLFLEGMEPRRDRENRSRVIDWRVILKVSEDTKVIMDISGWIIGCGPGPNPESTGSSEVPLRTLRFISTTRLFTSSPCVFIISYLPRTFYE